MSVHNPTLETALPSDKQLRRSLLGHAAGLVVLFAGAVLIVTGSSTDRTPLIALGVALAPIGAGLLGWAVIVRNRALPPEQSVRNAGERGRKR